MPLAPVPLGALLLCVAALARLPAGTLPWPSARLAEAAWLCFMPFWLAALGQLIGGAVSAVVWRASRGDVHLDCSPRRWHTYVAFAISLLPLIALQGSATFLDGALALGLQLAGRLGPLPVVHLGYDPQWSNLAVVAVFPLVVWQTRRLVARIPDGRLVGLQRELSRLRGAVGWQTEAWTTLVAEAFDRWLADLRPPERDSSLSGKAGRRHRLRWTLWRQESIAAWSQAPPDLARAQRALMRYREGR